MHDEPLLRQVSQDDQTPKYLQAQQILTEAIRLGRLPAGTKLPPTNAIGAMVNVSLITAQKALEGMVEAGLLRREVGRGTFVCDDVAEAIAAQRAISIALVLDRNVNVNDFYHASIIEGLRRAARSDQKRVEFYFQDESALHRLRKDTAGAICLHPLADDQHEVTRLANSIPVVVLGGTLADAPLACVDCDNRAGAQAIVAYLLALGHRRFMIVSGPTHQSNARDRVEGAIAELETHGIVLDPRDLIEASDSVTLDARSNARLKKRFSANDRPTAVIAGGFYLALGVLQEARQAQLDIPGDISLVGFDDPASAPLLDPPLTTVRQPLQLMAERAYETILRAVKHGMGDLRSCRLPTELVVRESAGPAPEIEPDSGP